jgi:hypothetical protein
MIAAPPLPAGAPRSSDSSTTAKTIAGIAQAYSAAWLSSVPSSRTIVALIASFQASVTSFAERFED